MDAEEIKQKLEEFDKRWNIVDDKDYKIEFAAFKTRFNNIIKEYYSNFKYDVVINYCQICGIELEGLINQYSYPMDAIPNSFKTENNDRMFYKKIQTLFYSLDINDILYVNIFTKLKDVLLLSKVNLEISGNNNGIILYPKGEKELDDKLVNQVLSFLNPESNKLFTEGLTSYLEGTDRSFIDAVDKMRRTLEEFLRFKLNNSKGLDKNILELNKIHKANAKDVQLRKIIETVFSYLDKYFNDNTKHKDGDINDNECEYIIYQTGVLLRYISNLNLNN